MKFKSLNAGYKTKTKNPFANEYFKTYLKNAVEIANLKGDETVIDFGCNDRILQGFLPRNCATKYIGFDIVKDKTDYKDYKQIKEKIDVAFCIHVLEHAGEKESKKFIAWCKKKKIKKIVLVTPAKTIISDLLSFFSRYGFVMGIHHKMNWIEVHRLLADNYGNSETRLVWFMSWISVWDLNKKESNTK